MSLWTFQLQTSSCSSPYPEGKHCLFVCNRGDTILHHGGLHTDLNQCNQGSLANPLYVVWEGPDIMCLEPDQAGTQSDSPPTTPSPSHTPIWKRRLHIICRRVYNRYNGCWFILGPVSKLAIFGSRKNLTNCVTDHTKGLLNETLLLSSLHSSRIAYLTPLKFLHEDHRCSGSSRAVLQKRHR